MSSRTHQLLCSVMGTLIFAGMSWGQGSLQTVQKLIPATVGVEWKVNTADEKKVSDNKSVPNSLAAAGLAGNYILKDAAGIYTVNGLAAENDVDSVTYASGTVVSADGFIVTTIGEEKGGELHVTFSNGKTHVAKVCVVDNRSGLRLLKIDAESVPSVAIGAFKGLLGEPVATVYCSDLEDRVALVGIVSAQDRAIKGLTAKVIRTDIAGEAMSAGAPLVKLNSGELMGILVAKSEDAAGSSSFAVPSKYVNDLLSAKKDGKFVTIDRGFLGVRVGDADPTVTEVLAGTPAEKAGVEKGDVILLIDGRSVDDAQDVVALIGQNHAGAEVTVKLRRDEIDQEVRVVLSGFPETKLASAKDAPPSHATNYDQAILGFAPQGAGQYGLVPLNTQNGFQWYPANQQQFNWNDDGMYRFTWDPQTITKAMAQPATVKVERSNVEKQLSELSTQVRTLASALETLNTEIKTLSRKIEESSK